MYTTKRSTTMSTHVLVSDDEGNVEVLDARQAEQLGNELLHHARVITSEQRSAKRQAAAAARLDARFKKTS